MGGQMIWLKRSHGLKLILKHKCLLKQESELLYIPCETLLSGLRFRPFMIQGRNHLTIQEE